MTDPDAFFSAGWTPGGTFAMKKLLTRFWSKVRKTPTCWIWIGHTHIRGGYGLFHCQGRQHYAHRIAYFLQTDIWPGKQDVLHRCDTPSCVNLDHLYLGNDFDNKQDSMRRGRHAFGERAGSSKMTEHLVGEIRTLFSQGNSSRKLASQFGIGHTAILQIVRRNTWKHI